VETLFTPWRFPYLTSAKSDEGCIFCNAAEGDDAWAALRLYRDDSVVVILNRYPYTNGHLMVAPRLHAARLEQTKDEVLAAVMKTTAMAQRVLSSVYRPEGFNIGMNIGAVAGAGVADHYHMHIVPRWGGDTSFMTVTASTRLIPEDLEITFAKLAPLFEELTKEQQSQ
jgi:ATP adenylyltransferase